MPPNNASTASLLSTSAWLRPRVPYLALILGLLVTALATYLVHRSVDQRDRAAFESESRLAAAELQKRLDSYESVIQSTGQIIYVVPKAGPETFYTYLKGLDLMRRYPGIRGLGITVRIPDRMGPAAFTAMVRRNGMRDFAIYPAGRRDEYHTIIALYPRDRWNRRAIGYDMHADSVRADAMDRARDSGKPAVSGTVVLVQDRSDVPQPGFLIYYPLYLSRRVPGPEKRKGELIGFSYAPFRMREVFRDILRREVRRAARMEVTSGREPGGAVLYRSWDQPGGGEAIDSPRFRRNLPVRAADKWWNVSIIASRDYREGAGSALISLLAVSGSAVSLLLFGIMLYQYRSQCELDQRRQNIELLNEHLRQAMRETHHRVKNNLQVIAAMIDMQAMDSDPVLEPQLRRLAMHVTGLSAVHDILTDQARDTGQPEAISARKILQKLLPMLEPTTMGRPLLGRLEDDALLTTRQSTSLAIVVNELVSNAVKHGRGAIEVSFAVRDGVGVLGVSDDGPGFPTGFHPAASASTGLQIVDSLSAWDLGGGVRFENRIRGGAHVAVEITLVETEKKDEKPLVRA